jgi:small subunit ribosomal protein S2
MNVSLNDLIKSGVHFGHQTRRWNPKMAPYIYGAKNGIHIIDLQQTARGLIRATNFINGVVSKGGEVLFVGTKRAAQAVVCEEAERAGMPYVNHRWLGGMLTNWQTVKKSIERLVLLETQRDEGRFEAFTKKEALKFSREIEKKARDIGGVKAMSGKPAAIFIIDPAKEHIAVTEANRLKIPIVALCDTNCDPTGVDYIIPGNDDALKAIRLFTKAISDTIIDVNAASSVKGEAHNVVVPTGNEEDVEIIRRS